MLFNSMAFAVFLLIVFFSYWLLPHKFRWVFLLLSSYWFYMSWNIGYVVLILLTTLVSWCSALLLERTDSPKIKKMILTLAAFCSLGVLFFFKYFNFFSKSITSAFRAFSIPLHEVTLHLLLPVGISFYTFQTLSYVIDVYRGKVKAERNIGYYATFISFFPQLVAGPIERTERLLPQIKEWHLFRYDQAAYGLRLMAWGFFKKIVIADNFAVYVDEVYQSPGAYRGFAMIISIFLFAIQIYCDFSGYSDIAIGTAKLFGIELTPNFKSPYFATSVKEFWSRWHISLSTWFRDYVYIPMGGNRTGWFRHKFNLIVTFLASGLWHGANWTYVFWGGIHGVLQTLETGFPKPKKEKYRIGRVFLTFMLICAAWNFFRASSIEQAFYIFAHCLDGIASPIYYVRSAFWTLHITKIDFIRMMICLFLLILYDRTSQERDVLQWLGRQRVLVRWPVYFAMVLLILFWGNFGSSAFIYFQF